MSFAIPDDKLDELNALAAESAKLLGSASDGTEQAQRAAAAVNGLGDKIRAAGIVETVSDQRASREHDGLDFIADRHGLPDGVRQQMHEGKKVTRDEVRAVRVWKENALRDPDFVKRFLAGDRGAGREMALADIVLSSEIQEAVA